MQPLYPFELGLTMLDTGVFKLINRVMRKMIKEPRWQRRRYEDGNPCGAVAP